jgi:sugar lactone lactonase YvrE/DNA-binding IclR family transcriptional regulator
MPKGTLHRLLQALADERLVWLDPRDQTYRLAARVFEWAHKVWDEFDLRGAAEPELERLRDLSGEAIRLGVLDDAGTVLYIDQREAAQPLRLNDGVGSRVAAHASGLGKAILAHLSLERRRALLDASPLERTTPNTIIDREELVHQLDLIKARGYAVSVDEQHIGISSVAAPVLDHRAQPIGAIGIIGPTFRLPVDRLHALGRDVIEAARRTSGNIGEVAMTLGVQPRPLGPDRADVHCAIPASAFLGEGPHWSERDRKLYFVDILAPAMLTGDPARGTYATTPVSELIGFVIPRQRGGFVAGMHGEIRGLDAAGGETVIARPEASRPGNRFNDGKCDRRGRLWAGTLAIDTTPGQGRLWRIDAEGQATEMDRGFHVANGLGWSPDNRILYFVDTARHIVYAYDFDIETGEIAGRRVFITVPDEEGRPDGLTVDSEGFLWIAHWDGWCVTRYDPDGKVERVINLPVPRPTSCVFGGADMQTLFVTSARIRLSAAQLTEAPLSGSVFSIDTGIKGLPEAIFAG